MHRGGGVLAETGSDGTGSSGPLGVDEHIKYTRDRQDCRNLQPARKGSVFREENGTVLGQKRACLSFRSYLAVQVPVKEGFLRSPPGVGGAMTRPRVGGALLFTNHLTVFKSSGELMLP